MSVTTNANENWTNVTNAWAKVGEAVNLASELYLKELSAYLDWAHGVQREVLEQELIASQELSRFGERQLAFLARLRERAPLFGNLPTGTETVQGIVQAVIRETGRTR